MANPEHLAILKQGVEVWNKWREENPEIRPELMDADLRKMVLIEVNFGGVNLNGTDFSGANLSAASLIAANLIMANFTEVNLILANLTLTNFTNANLKNTNLAQTALIKTVFGDVDLSSAKGLESCFHLGPSVIDHATLMKSKNLPLPFLRGCGLPDDLIEYLPSFRHDPVQFYSCFISYSSKDDEYARRLHADLQDSGVRCWFAPEDLKIGDKTRRRIDDSIRVHDKLLLILSENSIASDWVEYEAERALEQERKRGGTVLFPVRLDDSIMDAEGTWADHIRDRHIGDFRDWKDHDSYQEGFERLLRDLKEEK